MVTAIVADLVALGAPAYGQDEPDVWAAAVSGDLYTLRRALDAGVDPDAREPNGVTPLFVAAMFGQTDLVRVLMEQEAALGLQDNDGAAALHVASLFGHPRAVTALLAAGVAPDLRNNDGQTALALMADPWSAELDGLYEFLGVVFQMNLDIDRIRAVRPEVRTILQSAG